MSSNRVVAAVNVAAFAVVGLWGLVASLIGGSDAGASGGVTLAGQVGTTVILALAHLALAGGIAIGWIRGDASARRVNTAAGTVLLALGLFGLFAIGTPANVLGLTGATNVLHFAASTALLAAGLGAAASPAPADSRGSRQGDGSR